MSTPMILTRTYRAYARPTLRAITVAALVVNALLFLFDVFSSGPDDINVNHVIISLLFAGIAAIRVRWVPALGALLCVLQLVEGSMFLGGMLTQPDSAATFAFAAIFFAISLVGLVAGVGATVQNYRAPRGRPFVDQPAPGWTYPALLALIALTLGGILSTAIQPHGASTSFSPEALAALPALTAKGDMFDRREITTKVGETVVLRLDNADTNTHYIVTMLEDDSVFAAMRAGARGYVVKGAEPTEVLRAIRAVADGEAIFSPAIAERLMHYFATPPAAADLSLSAAAPIFPDLTEREREVLVLIAQWLTNSAIAERLVLSPKTVRNYITEIFSKLQVADRAQAIIRARNAGLG